MDASSSTSLPSKKYINVRINNYVELVAAKDKMMKQPPGTVLCIYIPVEVDGYVASVLRRKASAAADEHKYGLIFLEHDPEKKDEGSDSCSEEIEIDYSSFKTTF